MELKKSINSVMSGHNIFDYKKWYFMANYSGFSNSCTDMSLLAVPTTKENGLLQEFEESLVNSENNF